MEEGSNKFWLQESSIAFAMHTPATEQMMFLLRLLDAPRSKLIFAAALVSLCRSRSRIR